MECVCGVRVWSACVECVCGVRVWSVCGVCVECVWSVCGVCVECVWSVSLTGMPKCSVAPRPVLPRTPNDKLSSRKMGTRYLLRSST